MRTRRASGDAPVQRPWMPTPARRTRVAGPGSRRHDRSLIRTVLSADSVASAEAYFDVAASAMFPAESAVVARSAAARRHEFATVRHCARQALHRIGAPALPLLPDADGVPQWPAGVVGSMTHCDGYRAAVVAHSFEWRGIGIDAEPHAALPDEMLDLILRNEEHARLRWLANTSPAIHWDRVLFCAKEAFYKAWFPWARRWLDFADVSVTLRHDGTFEARIPTPAAGIADGDGNAFHGRWTVGRNLVVAAVLLRRADDGAGPGGPGDIDLRNPGKIA